MEKTVFKGLNLLEALAKSDRPRGVSELGRELGFSKSNVHRLLETLCEAGYVRTSAPGLYEMTLKVWHLGSRVISRFDMKKVARPYLEELQRITGETARLSVLDNDHAVCVEQVESDHPIRVQTPIGGRLKLYCSSTGKAILAFQSQELVDRVAREIHQHTPLGVATKDSLDAELDRIRSDGFAINRGERLVGVTGVAAPLRDRSGDVIAAIGVSGPIDRLSLQRLYEIGPIIRGTAEKLSRDLGAVLPNSLDYAPRTAHLPKSEATGHGTART